ncbi:YeeE/YedE family protein [Pandoraea nosoerga]|uniref:YeeE/YedE n=1 Tax=Pandoraea nosoerga TaxID=2508296 RepID=A0A5E4WAE5_9BURK|nr:MULTISPECIES: YeeE/YedE family protein [Pandoraea]MBN4666306.1 YeeE/YedE family protein [Pandoraea nosoerga]MBN4676014.1 YeeE/YedE family protein [Pandoraea nosoerga]MBN4682109.1 YeeE/YedE family protein [Pandoraea nosoerga]MBN4747207.1 YeeE/YedE family protein [Pandoraea nosoerga]VVE20270.1 YeeE/YedE [Pandoraea nosoerga]
MTIDTFHFTPWTSLAGGVLIGVAAVWLMLANGRIAGISGILGGLLRPRSGDVGWRVAFVLGLMAAPWVYQAVALVPEAQIEASTAMLAAAGLTVGFGTRLGSGCTSGHGVCGLSRLSWRSLVATLCFMATGFLTVFVVRHVLDFRGVV